jgi:mannitol-1-phosphate 5-dehydrogenase
MSRTFVGFGFGPIQSALFLYEAYKSGDFGRYVVSEVDQELVDAVRASDGQYTINIARPNRIDQVQVRGVELYNPRQPADRRQIVRAIAQADELATALPSVKLYDAGDQASVAALLAEGLPARDLRPAVVYAAENDNDAAELLQSAVERRAGRSFDTVQFSDTVIGKMSGVITDPDEIARLNLKPITPHLPRAVLVEEFNRILISRIDLPGFVRGIEVFIEKSDLHPFEEAKLYGHNAIHALIGYLAHERGLTTLAQAADHPELMSIARAAFLEESGAALARKYKHLNDALFSAEGYRAYAEDLLARMVNPNLNDLVSRVIRDPQRKLGWNDRIYGTMRLALSQGIVPVHLAQGAAAAVRHLAEVSDRPILSLEAMDQLLRGLWGVGADASAGRLVELTWQAHRGA